jgi:phosphoribosyl-AMP cyclohydrolase / phosphoribosyl-ATP pyrophosphohydrolase
MNIAIDTLKFDERGLIPAVVQDAGTHRVLMLAFMNAESLKRTLESNETWFWSRSRSRLWHKGETSGHTQRVVEVQVDCDGDALTVLVHPNGPACHTGTTSCFDREMQAAKESVTDLGDGLARLQLLIESRKRERPEGSYTSYLFDQGLDKILKKVGEETAETIIAAKNDDREALVREVADLLYHLVVLMVECELSLEDVAIELERRQKH